MIFLVLLSRKMIFFPPKILSYSLDGKWKMIFLKKYIGSMIFSSNAPKTWSFQKKLPWNMIFLVYLERWYFFPGKYEIFSFDRKWKMIFLKKYMEIWYFLYIRVNVTNTILPFCKKKQKWSSPEKSTVKADWNSILHSRKSSNDSLYFYGDLHRRFHIFAFQWKNNQET